MSAAATCRDWLLKETDYNWRLLAEEGGDLRAVGDIGTHWLDTASFVLGAPVERLLADLSTFHKQRRRPLGEVKTFAKSAGKQRFASYDVRTEDFANILLGFGNGARGSLVARKSPPGERTASAWKSTARSRARGGARKTPTCSTSAGAMKQTPRFPACAEFGDASGFTDYPAATSKDFRHFQNALSRDLCGHRAREDEREAALRDRRGWPRRGAVCEAILKTPHAAVGHCLCK